MTTTQQPLAAAGDLPADAALPEPLSGDFAPCLVYARVEILANLRILVDHRVPVTIHCQREAGTLASRILAMNVEFDKLLFHRAPDYQSAEKLQAADDLTVVSNFNHIKVQFTISHAELTSYQRAPAFRVRIPQSILRLQRRAAFRVPTPLANPADVLLPPTPDERGDTNAARLRIADISATGFGLVAPPGRPILRAGMRLAGCRIRLIANEAVEVDIEIRRVSAFQDESGRELCKAACRLLTPSREAEMAIERYVHRLAVMRGHNP